MDPAHPPESESPPAKLSGRKARSRRLARLAAVQALHQMETTGAGADAVVSEFLDHRVKEGIDGVDLSPLDRAFFEALVRGVSGEEKDLDDILVGMLPEAWPLGRLDALLRVILRGGAFELGFSQETPARSVISEYVGLAHDFFGGKEPAMANGILDAMARVLRSDEF